MNAKPSEKWTVLEKYVYGEHKVNCLLENGGYACTCGKQEAAAELAALTIRVMELEVIEQCFFEIVSPDGFYQQGNFEDCPSCEGNATDGHKSDCKLITVLKAGQA